MADKTLGERVGSLEGRVRELEARLEEMESPVDLGFTPKRRGNPNWVKRVVQEDQ